MSAIAYLWTIEIDNNGTGRFREKIESLCMELRMMLGCRQCCYRVVRQQCDPNGNRRPGGRPRHCRRRWPRGHDRCWRAGKDLFTGASGQIFCFTLAPELAAGTTMEFSDAELAYLPEGTVNLPYLGTLSGGELQPQRQSQHRNQGPVTLQSGTGPFCP